MSPRPIRRSLRTAQRRGGRRAAPSDIYLAISEPTRRRLLDALGHGERAVNDLARPFRMSRPAVSQHLRILLDVGLVSVRREGRERRYRLRAAPLREVYDWVEHYKKFWTEKLTALGKYLDRQAKGGKEFSGLENKEQEKRMLASRRRP